MLRKLAYRTRIGQRLISGEEHQHSIEERNTWVLFHRSNRQLIDFEKTADYKYHYEERLRLNKQYLFIVDRLNNSNVMDFSYKENENDRLILRFNPDLELYFTYLEGKWQIDLPDIFHDESWSYWRINFGIIDFI